MRLDASRGTTALTVLLALAGLARPTAAQELRALSLALDNDGLAVWTPPGQRQDWYYTHGTRLEATLAGTPPLLGRLLPGAGDATPCPPHGGPEACTVTHVRLGQQIFTPQSLFDDEPPEGDRPYAGWLYVGLGAERTSPNGSLELAVEVGVTGRPSFGRQAHLAVHRWLDKYPPQGWDTEIPFEVAFLVRARRTWWHTATSGPASVALIPRWEASLGTVRTGLGGGLEVMAGWNASPDPIWSAPDREGGWAVVRAGFEGELVVRDLFLDGSTFGQSVSAERRPLVGRLHAGLEVGWNGLGLEFSVVRASRAFEVQEEPHTFATIGFVIR
jgi:hypothetical protein